VPKRLSSREIVRILTDNGFAFVSQKGSHQKFRNAGGRIVIVPADRKEIPIGTLSSIIRQSGLDPAFFR
jgi:predicted RNA binding protein YcfA (HicA-like mRNA interferase family)